MKVAHLVLKILIGVACLAPVALQAQTRAETRKS
jgi:hypothetical protein